MKSHLLLKNNLKEYRKAKKLSQTELANMVGSSTNTICAIEKGQFSPSAFLAYLLCLALECKFEDLFYVDEEDLK